MKSIPSSLIFMALLGACHAETADKKNDCDPSVISRESTCSQYLKIDSELNKEYKILISNLSKDDVFLLRSTQREWIKWRSDRCNEAQEDSGCQSGSCVGVEHDSCILQLTFTRTSELKKFSEDPQAAKYLKFKFSQKTRFDDE